MSKLLISFIPTLLIVAFSTSGLAQRFDEINLNYHYNSSTEFYIKCLPVVNNDSLKIAIDLTINQGKARLYDYTFNFYSIDNYDQKLEVPINKELIDSTHLNSENSKHLLLFKIPSQSKKFLIIEISSKFSGINYYYDYEVSLGSLPRFVLNNHGKSMVYTWSHENLYPNREVTVFRYNYEFPPALPPMVTKSGLPDKLMTIDSVFSVSSLQPVSFRENALYLLQTDTTAMQGRGIVGVDKYFPKMTTLNKLKEPLIYLTTKDEMEELKGVTTKKEFDEFWLDLTESPDRAKRIIRNFYNRVEEANWFFTGFKEGWKTDQGMIYIIFGPPDELIKTGRAETWIYLENSKFPKIKFTFARSPNPFTASYYVLMRDKKFDAIWFRAVDLWRKSRF